MYKDFHSLCRKSITNWQNLLIDWLFRSNKLFFRSKSALISFNCNDLSLSLYFRRNKILTRISISKIFSFINVSIQKWTLDNYFLPTKPEKSILRARRLFVKKRFPEFYLRINNNENIRRNILNEFPLSTSDLFFSRGQRVSRAVLNWKLYEMYDLTYEWAYFRSFFDF